VARQAAGRRLGDRAQLHGFAQPAAARRLATERRRRSCRAGARNAV
jgi:hypothetical protein